MEQHHDTMAMLDLIMQPAFCVKDGVILRVNKAAESLTIEAGTPVVSLLTTGQTENEEFIGGGL